LYNALYQVNFISPTGSTTQIPDLLNFAIIAICAGI